MRMNKEVVMVRLSDIIPNRFQPRLTFDEDALNELANSIKEHGIIQPLILRNLGSKYEIIAGERRYKASGLAGLTEVPAIIGTMDDQKSAELALIENIQRKDLSAIEEAKSYKKILDMGNFTQDELAKRMGKSQSTIANKMRLLALTNEVQVALMNNLISERHARCLLQIKDEDKQKEVLNKIITERMNVRDTDDYIKNMLGLPKMEPPKENNDTIISLPQIEVPTNSVPNNFEPEITVNPEVNETIKVPQPDEKISENPNVYTQSNNMDFINLDKLSVENPVTHNEEVSTENYQETEEEPNMPELTNIIENEKVEMPNVVYENKPNDLSKVKLATAIKLAKDTVKDIKAAGYNVKVEEIDTEKDYQIIIKVEK